MLGRLGDRVGRLRGKLPVAVPRRRVPLVEQRESAPNALERLDALALELDEHAGGIGVGAATDLLGLALALIHDLPAPDLGCTRQLALLDQERSLLLGAGEDALALFLGALDEARRFLVD